MVFIMKKQYILFKGYEYCTSGITDLKESIGKKFYTDSCTILWCEEGMAVAYINTGKCAIRKGDLILLFEDSTFILSKVSRLFSVRCVVMNTSCTDTAFRRITSISFWDALYLHPVLKTNSPLKEQLDIWYKQIQWILDHDTSEHTLSLLGNSFCNLLMGIDSELKKMYVNHENIDKGRRWTLLEHFSTLVMKHCHRSRNVSFYADKLCISTDYLYKLTSGQTGQSPKEFIDQYVVMRISTLLSATDLSLKSIADDMGFEDTSYMCRFFRRRTGISPNEFRQKA